MLTTKEKVPPLPPQEEPAAATAATKSDLSLTLTPVQAKLEPAAVTKASLASADLACAPSSTTTSSSSTTQPAPLLPLSDSIPFKVGLATLPGRKHSNYKNKAIKVNEDLLDRFSVPIPLLNSSASCFLLADGHGEVADIPLSVTKTNAWLGTKGEQFMRLFKIVVRDVLAALIHSAAEEAVAAAASELQQQLLPQEQVKHLYPSSSSNNNNNYNRSSRLLNLKPHLNSLHLLLDEELIRRNPDRSLLNENGCTLLAGIIVGQYMWLCSIGDSSMIIIDKEAAEPLPVWKRPNTADILPAVCSYEDTLASFPVQVREGQSLMAVKVDYEQVLGHIRRTISKNGMPYYKIVSARSPYGLALTNTVGNLHHKGCLVGDAGLGRTTIYEYDLVKDLKLTPGSNDGGSILVALCSDGVKDVLQAADIARFAGGVERAVLHLVVHEMETAAAAAKAAVLSSFRSSSLFGIRGIGNNSSTAPSSISIHDLETEPIELMVKRLMRGYSSDRFDSKACQDLTDIIIKESEYDGLITISDTSINSIINQDVSTTCNNIAATNNSASCSTASLSSASSSHDLNDLCHAVISLAVLRKSYDDVSMIVVEISGCDLPCTKEALTKQQPTRQQTDGGSDSMVILETDAEAATAAAIALATAANICEIDQGSPMMGVTDLKGTLSPPSLSKVTVHSRGSSALPSAILLGTGGVQPNVSGEEEGDEVTSSNVLEKGLAVDGKEVSLSSLDEVGSTSQGDAEPNLCESGILELSRAPPASSFTSVAAVAASDSPIIPSTTTSDTFAYPMYIPPHPPLLDTKTCMLPSLPALLCENMQSSSTNDPMMMEQITYQSPPADVVPPTVEPDTTATSSDVVVDGSIGRHVSWAAKPTSAASLSYSSLSTLETTIATTLPASPLLPPLLKTAPIITDHCVVGIGMDTDENVMSVISMEKGCAIGTGQQQESEAVTYILNSVANSSNSAAASNSAISVLQQLQRFFPISQAPTISSTTQPLFTATASSTPMIPEPLDLPLSSMDSSPEIASAAEPMCISTIKDSSTAIAAATVATLAPTPSTYTTTACNSNVSPTSSLKRDSRAVSGIEATSQDERDEETGSISEISGLEEESSSVPSSSLARDQTLLSPMKKQKDDSLKNQTLNISP